MKDEQDGEGDEEICALWCGGWSGGGGHVAIVAFDGGGFLLPDFSQARAMKEAAPRSE